jgi:hypothetical protein
MNNSFCLFIALSALAGPCARAQWLDYKTPGIPRLADGKPDLSAPAPKTADGKTDLSGLWRLRISGGGVQDLKPSEIQPWAEALFKQRQENLGSDGPIVLCLPAGFIPLSVPGEGGMLRFVQTSGLILILAPDLEYRQIFLDGRELPKEPNPAWMGYSVGRWEGDTLVVESTGYNERTWLSRGYPHTENLHLTERFHRDDFGHLSIETTFSDPTIYAKPWTTKVSGLYAADTDLIEYVCAENEKDRVHLVGRASDDKKNAVKLSPEILSRYVGNYEIPSSQPGGLPNVFKVAMEDGELNIAQGGGPKAPLTALSETEFAGRGAHFVFGKNDRGEVTYMILRVAEGDLRGERKP